MAKLNWDFCGYFLSFKINSKQQKNSNNFYWSKKSLKILGSSIKKQLQIKPEIFIQDLKHIYDLMVLIKNVLIWRCGAVACTKALFRFN
ncbi:hypothetical protein BpHYR1_021738 [Brachionus plicatilis]|uniref:Uncharacterized protein n=1 Tax=Brachionus plicatilis TaxID=10195 RepID=A0A3M7RWU1_BRAPC|nr:hypothetical protein BpHYR1_021738 [Brachionus plicatilis]